MEWIIILAQLIFTILLYLFIKYNYQKIDNWLVVLFGIPSLIPFLGGIIIFAVLVGIFTAMAEENELPNTKLNRFLFKSKFNE